MPERCLQWTCEGDTLVGIQHEPDGEARDLGVLVIVGGPQYRVGSHRQFVLMARKLAAAGYPVLRFDYRGMGDSEGERRNFAEVEKDIRSGITALARHSPGCTRFAIFGLCDAASAALMYAAQDERLSALALANPWVRSERTEAKTRIRYYYRDRIQHRDFWLRLLTGRISLRASVGEFAKAVEDATRPRGGNPKSGRDDFLQRMKQGAQQFRGPILLLMSERDLTAREFDELCRADAGWSSRVARSGWTRIDLPGADHTWSSATVLNSAGEALVGWLASLAPVSPRNGVSLNGDVSGSPQSRLR